MLIGGIFFFRKQLFSLSLRDILSLAVLGLLGIVGMSVFLFYGQQYTTAINSSLIMQLNPVFIIFFGLFVGEKVRLSWIAGILLSLTGCLLVVEVITPNGFVYEAGHVKGDLFILLSALCWAAYTVGSKPIVKKRGGYATTTWVMICGTAELILLRLVLPVPFVYPREAFSWTLILYIAIFPTGIAFFAWYEAMNRIKLHLLNVMQYLTPVFTILLAWVFLGEKMNFFMWLGAVFVLCGVMFIGFYPVNTGKEDEKKSQEYRKSQV